MAKKLLLVDDDRDMLKLLGLAFYRKGYEVVGAENGESGLKKAKEEYPDLIILDVMLPDISGLEVCERLRKDPATSDIPIILLSARGQTLDKVAGFQAGADDYVSKPFDMSELVARIESILARRAVRRVHVGRVITFVGAKGGVGTSTVAANIATAIVNRGKLAVLADFHLYQGTLCYQLGLTPRRTIADLVTVPLERLDERAVKLSLEPHYTGLRVLAAPEMPMLEEPSEQVAEHVFENLRAASEFVIIDAPIHASRLARAAFTRSDVVAVVVEPHTLSIASAMTMLTYLERLGVKGDWVGAVLVNRSRSAFSISPAEVQDTLKVGILGVIPSAEDACLSAERQRMPLLLAQPEHLASVSLYELADRLMASRIVALKW